MIKISPELICAGRKREAETLLNRLKGGSAVILVQAATKDEAIAFVAATVLLFGDDSRENILAKTIIVANPEDFNILLNDQPSIIIPLFNHISVLYAGAAKNHHVPLPVGADDKKDSESKISLPKLEREEIMEGLQGTWFNKRSAEVLIQR